ncbi:MAG TPA: pyridoxal phosphate-dependent aminotransferase, partial [Alphaproteobacteria bacterium]|nr:pyridoxal phosphate-dependent aminotransferase [Alphaproteobacteria bacterium]
TPRTRGVVVVHPNNPTGHFTKAEEAVRLGQICAAQGMAVIADEVFLGFSLATEPAPAAPRSFAGSSGALTLTMSGLSKICGLPQMKLAWLVVSGPEQLKLEALARLEVIADTYLSVSTPVQLAAAELLAQRSAFQTQVMKRVRKNMAELDRQLAAQSNCSRLKAEGGWYAVLRLPVTNSDEDTAINLLEKHDVYVHPGHFYDFAQEGVLVVSLITPEKDFARGIEMVLKVAG